MSSKIKQDPSERDYIIIIEPEPMCTDKACFCSRFEDDRETCKLWKAFQNHHLRIPNCHKENTYVYEDSLELRRRVDTLSPKDILSYIKTCLDKFAEPCPTKERGGYDDYQIRILEEWA